MLAVADPMASHAGLAGILFALDQHAGRCVVGMDGCVDVIGGVEEPSAVDERPGEERRFEGEGCGLSAIAIGWQSRNRVVKTTPGALRCVRSVMKMQPVVYDNPIQSSTPN